MPVRAEKRNIAVLGCTGSIGVSTLDVVRHLHSRLAITALVAHSNVKRLAEQCLEFRPQVAVLTDAAAFRDVDRSAFPRETELLHAADAVQDIVHRDDVDVVVSAVVGAAGLEGTLTAVEAGKIVAIANKESFVVAGPLLTELATESGAMLLPVDSEHSAIAQAMTGHTAKDVARVVLTGSGGPFRGKTRRDLENATVQSALNHPTWKMGPKITVDSATLMNKALEVIEARWLFNLAADQIDVIIHPESIVHSFVEFVDGSVLAQLSPPDMRLPIQLALLHPERVSGPARRLDWNALHKLHFERPDRATFPALDLGFEAARKGGSVGAVLNAANEVAVAAFLDRRLGFLDIAACCRAVVDAHAYDASPGFTELLALDAWGRLEGDRWIRTHNRSTQAP
jgi:1-deoxy-D-xylulose-5-phosphate reductoisomerase